VCSMSKQFVICIEKKEYPSVSLNKQTIGELRNAIYSYAEPSYVDDKWSLQIKDNKGRLVEKDENVIDAFEERNIRFVVTFEKNENKNSSFCIRHNSVEDCPLKNGCKLRHITPPICMTIYNVPDNFGEEMLKSMVPVLTENENEFYHVHTSYQQHNCLTVEFGSSHSRDKAKNRLEKKLSGSVFTEDSPKQAELQILEGSITNYYPQGAPVEKSVSPDENDIWILPDSQDLPEKLEKLSVNPVFENGRNTNQLNHDSNPNSKENNHWEHDEFKDNVSISGDANDLWLIPEDSEPPTYIDQPALEEVDPIPSVAQISEHEIGVQEIKVNPKTDAASFSNDPTFQENKENKEEKEEKEEKKEEEIRVKNAMVLMIGISEYDKVNGDDLDRNLPTVKKDVENFRHLFKTVLKYEWRESPPRMTDNSLIDLLDSMTKDLRRRRPSNDFAIIVLYCGHGGANDELVMSDGSKVSLATIRTKFYFNNLPGYEETPKLLILDACRGISLSPSKKMDSIRIRTCDTIYHNSNDEFIEIWSIPEGFSAPDYGMVSKEFDQVMSAYCDGNHTIEHIVKKN